MAGIDPEKYGSFKGEIRTRIKVAEEKIDLVVKGMETLGNKMETKLEEAVAKMVDVVETHMKEEEAAMKLQGEANTSLCEKFSSIEATLTESRPAIELLKKIIIILDFFKIFTKRNVGTAIAILAFIFAVFVPLSQSFFAPGSIQAKIIEKLTYGPALLSMFT